MMEFTHFALQVFPFTILGLVISGLSAWLWPASLATGSLILRGLLLLLSFVGLMALKRLTNWNVAVLMIFAAFVGSFVRVLFPEDRVEVWWGVIVLSLFVVGVSSLFGWNWKGRWREVGIGFWLLAWIYLLGWLGFLLFRPDPIFQKVWGGFGLSIFAGMTMVWFSTGESAINTTPGSALGIELYLLTLNAMLAAWILLV